MKNKSAEKLWFKRRRYGYGWMPVAWQGWLSVLVFFGVIIGGMVVLVDAPRNEISYQLVTYAVLVSVAIAALVLISLKRGPKPKWRAGKSDTDDPSKDY